MSEAIVVALIGAIIGVRVIFLKYYLENDNIWGVIITIII